MSRDVVVLTSLVPGMRRMLGNYDIGNDYTRSCVASWRDLSEQIVSLNTKDEIERLHNYNYGVEFYECATRPRIKDFIKAARESGRTYAAIVNGDCFLKASRGALDAALKAASRSGLVLFERLNVEPVSACPTGVSCKGFDLFLFNVEVLSKMSIPEQLMIGEPWWDYWFPICYRRAGGRLFRLPGPALLHLDHPIGHSKTSWLHGLHLYRDMAKNEPGFLSGLQTSRDPSMGELGLFADRFFEKLRTDAEIVEVEDAGALIELLSSTATEEFGNKRICARASRAELYPVSNLRRHMRWRSSAFLARLFQNVSARFAERMRRRALKNAPPMEMTCSL